jgi:isopenicillin-N epimerase
MSINDVAGNNADDAKTSVATLSRREVLLGTTLIVAELASPYLSARTVSAGPAVREPDWPSMRDRVALSRDLIYLNAANLTPGFMDALAVQHATALAVQRDPSFQARDRFVSLSERVRGRLADMLGAKLDEIAIIRNASEGNNIVAHGIDLQAGDEVLVTSDNHESNLESWRERGSRDGLVVKIVPTPVSAASPAEVLDSIARECTARTRVISVSHITNTTGLCYPVAELAQLTRARHVWLHVDGAQSFGWRPIDVGVLGCDSYTASMHKWAMGPIEIGLLYVRSDHLDRIKPLVRSFDYWAEYGSTPTGARRFERVGQRDDSKLAGIDRTLDLLSEIGLPRMQQRVEALGVRLRALLSAIPGVRVIGTGQPDISGPVLRAVWRGRTSQEVADELWSKRKIALAAVAEGLRFSPHIYNNEAELEETAALFGAALRR